MDRAMSFAQTLKQRRKACDLTQQELARQVGCAVVTIQRIEQGKLRPSRQVVERLAASLNIAADEREQFMRLARGVRLMNVSETQPNTPTRAPVVHSQLPTPLTPLIGREQEATTVGATLANPIVRLLTLIGPGGVGKTRLALQVAADVAATFADGAVFVDLVPISNPRLVLSSIAQALGMREMSGESLMDALRRLLRDQQILLVLDNVEQVLAAAPLVAELLAAAPHVKVLLTSRVVLGIYGEYTYLVPPLTLPDRNAQSPREAVMETEAGRLFVERAQAAAPGFHLTDHNARAVSEICHQLDGLPLALELAAARLKLFAPEALLARLSSRLSLLTGGPRDLAARQQTISATITWSYDLMDETEQTLFRRLSVFVGGWTMEAAEVVCSAEVVDGLAALVNKSLIRVAAAGEEMRFSMLETIREYARDRLDASGEVAELLRRHAVYYLAVSQQAEGQLTTKEDQIWLRTLEREQDNLRAVLEWSLGGEDSVLGVRLAVALGPYWELRGNLGEAKTWLALALNQDVASTPYLRAQALSTAAWIGFRQGHLDEPLAMIEESVALYRTCGSTADVARALHKLGVIAQNLGQPHRAEIALKEALELSEAAGDVQTEANILGDLGSLARGQGEYGRAQAFLEQGLALLQRLGDQQGVKDQQLICWTLWQLGNVARAAGDDACAESRYAEALAFARAVGDRGLIAMILHNQAFLAIHQADPRRAEALLIESTVLSRDVGNMDQLTWNLAAFGGVAVLQDRPALAVRMLSAADTWFGTAKRTVQPAERAEHENYLAAAPAHLTQEAFSAAWAEGRAMSLEQAIAEALNATSPMPAQDNLR